MQKLTKELAERKTRKEEVRDAICGYFRAVAVPTLTIANLVSMALVEGGEITPSGAVKAIVLTVLGYGLVGTIVRARINYLVNLI